VRDRIGWYVHHQGAGHAARALAIAAQVSVPLTLLSELPLEAPRPGVDVVRLPPDCDEGSTSADPTAGGVLHWAPLQPALAGPRTRLLVDWLSGGDVAGLVCDVSVEAALLARLCGVATIAVRMHGRRDDAPHRLGASLARAFLAPYPERLEDPTTPLDVRERTFYAGFPVAPRRPVTRCEARRRLGMGDGHVVLVALGRGGHTMTASALGALVREVEQAEVVVVGAFDPSRAPRGVRVDGWVDDVGLYVAAADVVVGAPGRGLVGEVAAARRPFVAVAQPRPFDEQHAFAERLVAAGVAVVPPRPGKAGSWSDAIDGALVLLPEAWDDLVDPAHDAAAAAARWVERTLLATPSEAAWT
jgi:UDP-N-acetylglucosamine--N-acetylmuramyl-(pentapeptide) pyrophosphoryl-undecaprenol N-acetylglucosamine transferase